MDTKNIPKKITTPKPSSSKRQEKVELSDRPSTSSEDSSTSSSTSSLGSKPKNSKTKYKLAKGTETIPLMSNTLGDIKKNFDSKGPRDFEKIRLLGKGSVGRVYLVRLKGTDQLFAMKVLKKDDMISRNKVKRVLTEREVLVSTSHPFIISLYYSFQSEKRLYFIMDYCAGGEFYRTIHSQKENHLSEETARFYSAEVLLALEYLHFRGFVYRDLKPENILLHSTGHIRLTDFDLSAGSAIDLKAVEATMNDPHTTAEPDLMTTSFVGTAEYLAPEIIAGKAYGAPVDWWTFGILLYEMVFGTTPFIGKTQVDTFNKIGKTHLKFPDNDVSKDCRNLIKKLLHPDPKKRLGALRGANEIKKEPWYKGIEWAKMRNATPPIVPKLESALDFRHFPSRVVDDDKDDQGDDDAVTPSAKDPFNAFQPIRKNQSDASITSMSYDLEKKSKLSKSKDSGSATSLRPKRTRDGKSETKRSGEHSKDGTPKKKSSKPHSERHDKKRKKNSSSSSSSSSSSLDSSSDSESDSSSEKSKKKEKPQSDSDSDKSSKKSKKKLPHDKPQSEKAHVVEKTPKSDSDSDSEPKSSRKKEEHSSSRKPKPHDNDDDEKAKPKRK